MKKLVVKIFKNKFLWIGILLVISLWLGKIVFQEKRKTQEFISYQVKRGNLTISVLEGGNLRALRSQKIINEVPGQRAILEVVEEGTQITEEDVKKGKVLIKLDAKDLEDKAEQIEINLENSWASYMEAQENLKIQKKQNQSDIREAKLKVKFARMDLEKYLGEELTKKIIEGKNLEFTELIENPSLGGESLNKKRELESKIELAKEETARAKDKVEWSKKLAEKGYITKSELEADKLSLRQKEISLEQAKLEYKLFLKYDFPKQVEKYLSEYLESLNDLERTKSQARSKLVQAEASVKSKKATYFLNKNKLENIKKQIAKCTIKATQPGFVVYETSGRPWMSSNPIQPGTTVRQFQTLLNLPDFSSMGVEVKIHESSVEKIKPGQKAVIKIDAFPGRTFTGKLKKIALMPDPTLKWLNPDVNVYVAQISLDESSDALKPGMSAQVEIIVKKLENVLTIPLIAVSFREGKPVCTVLKGRKLETRYLELGESNEEMVEVKKGLKEGETVIIFPQKAGYQMRKKSKTELRRFEKEIWKKK